MEAFSFFSGLKVLHSVAYKQYWEKLVYIMSKCFFRGNVCCQGWFENLREKGEKSVRRGSAVKAIFCKIFYIGGDTCFISAV